MVEKSELNLLTLLRTNLYTQKEMGKILGMKPHRVSLMVLRLERRGIINVERSYVQAGKITIYGMNQHETPLYRRRVWDIRKSLLIAEQCDSLRWVGRGQRRSVTVERIGCQAYNALLEKSPSIEKPTVSVWARISGWILNR